MINFNLSDVLTVWCSKFDLFCGIENDVIAVELKALLVLVLPHCHTAASHTTVEVECKG